ncbi:VWA domain-containing protein [Cyanobium sp. Aljojuca 7D2]|uniref:vWA domain-containing protein n=1 Tax=Cyanobium sp. Aljojuca 7D2 TaxID=2823698 RepID=UPI0020CE731D|nr:VWA domain-containing protein [Cyanobium sp. Aljojuca 7D2]MCP9891401.1 VWA domain-containing protein [Cyanobium sp. Aljojuca 7D2]
MAIAKIHPSLTVLAARPAACLNGCQLDVLVELNTPAPLASAQRQPVAIAIVIDRSGSMAEHKLQAACAAAQQLVRQLSAHDRVAVISFDNAVETVVPLGPPSEDAIARIDALHPGGSTALVDGWHAGLEALRDGHGIEQHHKRLLLLTDGQANIGPRRGGDVAPLLGQAYEEGISTSCIGLGEDYDERLLSAMAEAGQGNLVHLTAPQQLEAVFTAELEGLQLVIGRHLQLRLQPGPEVELTQIHNPLEANAEGWIDLGELQAGSTPSLALGLNMAPRPCDGPAVVELLKVQARWRDADEQVVMVEALLRLPVLEQPAWDALPLEEAVVSAVLLQQAARRRQEAMQSIDCGDEHASRMVVQRALDSVRSFKGNSAVQREEQLLGELLDLISTNKLSLARKVMGSQAFMRARGRKLRDQEGRDDL